MQAYFHYLRKFFISELTEKTARLTKRERQCLEYTAQGQRVEVIAKTLGLSLRTVHFHLQNANKKMGINNKYLAAMRWQRL